MRLAHLKSRDVWIAALVGLFGGPLLVHFGVAWYPGPPDDPPKIVIGGGGGDARESYSIAFDPAHLEPDWYRQQFNLLAGAVQDKDLRRDPDGAGGWVDTIVYDTVTARWGYAVDGKRVKQIAGPCVVTAVCQWDDLWAADDQSLEAIGRNDPLKMRTVTIDITP